MEFIANILVAVVSIVLGLVFYAMYALLQAIVGLLYPQNTAMVRWQRAALFCLLGSLLLLATGITACYLPQIRIAAFWLVAAGLLLLFVAGGFGYLVEKRSNHVDVDELARDEQSSREFLRK